ncbi:MAG: nuclear transport factor 2 family protein [Acidimicrobiales bacterium]|nr:nuclear transport factor 2 family protein [Acidimicrobiales bacterium]
MESWETIARESIRDLVARYNANGDTARFEQVLELFADDAVMVLPDGTYSGKDEIMTIFTGTRDNLGRDDAETTAPPPYIRHHTSTHQIDLVDDHTAKGRCYYQVLTPVGLDHWGRYVDTYRVVDGRWRFAERRVTVDGRNPDSLFPETN